MMKWKGLKLSPIFGWQSLGCICASLILVACSQPAVSPNDQDDSEQGHPASAASSPPIGKKLTELSGQASMPSEVASTLHTDSVNKKISSYVGRYHVQISCQDAFVQCSEGAAEYILTLAEDGSAYRSIVYTGKLFSEKMAEERNIRTYRRDTWSVNIENSELVVHLEEGAEFYYQVDEKNNLVLDLERTLDLDNQTNQHFFAAGYPMPTQAYRLIKDQ